MDMKEPTGTCHQWRVK